MPSTDDKLERAVRSCASALVGLAAHELNNRLAVMGETLGLLGDLTRLGKAGAAATARAHGSLEDQVGRALNIVRALSGVGTAFGTAADGFDAGAAVDALLVLWERRAARSSLRLERDFADGLPRVAGEPASLLCLLDRLLGRYQQALASGGSVAVRLAREGGGIQVRLAASGAAAAAAGEDEWIDGELARRLGGELRFEAGGAATIRLDAAR